MSFSLLPLFVFLHEGYDVCSPAQHKTLPHKTLDVGHRRCHRTSAPALPHCIVKTKHKMESSAAPLISNDEARPSDEREASRPRGNSLPKSLFSRPERVVVALTFAAGISGLLFGCKPTPPEQ